MKLSRLAKSLAADVNVKRRAKGLLPRPVCSNILTVFQYVTFCSVVHTVRLLLHI